MAKLTKALIESLSDIEDGGDGFSALTVIGWTPPPDNPDPPREPVRAWANVYSRSNIGLFLEKDHAYEYIQNYTTELVELIETGWCQLIPHDGSEECPVDPDKNVAYQLAAGNHGITAAEYLNWSIVTHYAVILPFNTK